MVRTRNSLDLSPVSCAERPYGYDVVSKQERTCYRQGNTEILEWRNDGSVTAKAQRTLSRDTVGLMSWWSDSSEAVIGSPKRGVAEDLSDQALLAMLGGVRLDQCTKSEFKSDVAVSSIKCRPDNATETYFLLFPSVSELANSYDDYWAGSTGAEGRRACERGGPLVGTTAYAFSNGPTRVKAELDDDAAWVIWRSISDRFVGYIRRSDRDLAAACETLWKNGDRWPLPKAKR